MKQVTERAYKVFKIENGTVIDHIPHWKAYKVLQILDLMGKTNLVTVGFGLDSRQFGKKDLLKIENKQLTQYELNKIALVAKNATINIIENAKIKHKFKVSIPRELNNLIVCENLGCITRHEKVPSKFYTISDDPIRVKCHYCETMISEKDIELL